MCNFDSSIISSEELWRKAAEADRAALAALASRYAPLVRSRALFFFGGTGELDDLVQEAFIGLLSAIESFKPEVGVSFGHFAGLCIDRALGNYVKSKKHRELSGCLPLDDALVTVGFATEELAELRDEYLTVLAGAKKKLSDFEYSVFCHCAVGYKNSEIAELMKVEAKSVDNAVHRFRRKLRSVNGIEI